MSLEAMTTIANTETLATSHSSIFSTTFETIRLDARSFSVLGFIWSVFSVLFRWVGKLVIFFPNSIFSVLQITFQITLSLKWILVLLAILVLSVLSIVRYRYLTLYSRLLEPNERQEPKLDPFLESRNKKKDTRFPNFLDGFLSAIKIFGYLDKNVFHELTRNMTTQKLDPNETFLIDESRGFSIVVEGTVQVYCKVGTDPHAEAGFTEEQDSLETLYIEGVKYQLLNTIKSGTTLSSLVSILKIFTRIFEEPVTPDSLHVVSQKNIELLNKAANAANAGLNYRMDYDSPSLSAFELDKASRGVTPSAEPAESELSSSKPVDILPSLIARASDNATIAIIPPELFARVVRKHPLSVSHIVQMIMTRLHRVTFQTAHSYLGLTAEIYQTEVNLNNNAKYELPSYLHDGVIQKLNSQLERQRSGLVATNSSSERPEFRPADRSRDTSSAGLRSPVSGNLSPKTRSLFGEDPSEDSYVSIPNVAKKKKRTMPALKRGKSNASRNIVLDSRHSSNPGDLFSNVPLSRKETTHQPLDRSHIDQKEIFQRTFSAEEETEDSSLRTAITESIFKLMGVDKKSLAVSSRPVETEPNSPQLGGLNGVTALQNINSMFSPLSSRRRFSSASSNLYQVLGSSSVTPSEDDLSSISGERRHLDFELLKKELADKLQVMLVKKNTKIIEQNQRTPGIFYVVDGLLQVSHSNGTDRDSKIYTIKPGGIAGYLGTFIGNNSFIDVSTITDLYVGFISKDVLEKFLEKYYILQLIIARNTVRFMDKELLLIDLALEWVQTQSGDSLYDQGDPANGIYMVLNGRFRSVHESNPSNTDFNNGNDEENKITVLSEHGQGDSLGEVEVLTASERPTSMVAVRDSETARIPRTLFEILALSKPSIMIKVTRIVAKKMKESNPGILPTTLTNHLNPTISALPSAYNTSGYKGSTDYRTITILPVKQGLPVLEFAQKLAAAFRACDRNVFTLNQLSTLSHLGRHAFDKLAKLKQSGFFADLEEKYQTVIYVADTPVSSRWTQTAISQGDCILLLADADSSPDIGDYERLLVKTKTTARTELILLHQERYVRPGQTNKWLKNRIWVHSHHHVQMAFKESFTVKLTTDDVISLLPLSLKSNKMIQTSQAKIANIKSKVGNLIKDDLLKIIPAFDTEKAFDQIAQDYKSDFMRLARLLSGNAVALVLGGGGSRGLSHIGIIKAIEEAGIPIDIIGGTSIGAFIGGLYAKDYDLVPIYGRAKQFSGRMASFWRMLSDVTYPVTSYITGHEFNRGIWKAFGDSRIEDFWIKFFATSTNITNSVMEIHSSGYAWRFIRASMSLAGLLPPITDNGSMLLDGGYIDNLPVEEMKSRGANIIFAVDVGSVDDRTPMDYGDSLSGLWVIFNRWNPFSTHPNVPTMAEIQLRLTYVASVNALEKAKRTPGVYYLRPPVENYSTLDFGRFDEIYRVGEAYGKMTFGEYLEKGTMPKVKGISKGSSKHQHHFIQRRNSI